MFAHFWTVALAAIAVALGHAAPSPVPNAPAAAPNAAGTVGEPAAPPVLVSCSAKMRVAKRLALLQSAR